MAFPNKEITFPVPWDNPVLYFLGSLVDTDHIRYGTAFICTDLTALSELFLLPQVFDQLLVKLSFGKHVQIGINSFMTRLHILIVWMTSLQVHSDLNWRPAKLQLLYNKAMQFWITCYPSFAIVSHRKIISTIVIQPWFILITTRSKMFNLSANRTDISP